MSVLHLCGGAQQAGCWPSPFGSALAARTPATSSHPATCAKAPECGLQFSPASFQSLLIHWLSLEFRGLLSLPVCRLRRLYPRAFLCDQLLAFPSKCSQRLALGLHSGRNPRSGLLKAEPQNRRTCSARTPTVLWPRTVASSIS